MRTRTTRIEWHFTEDPEEWNQLSTLPSRIPPKRLPQRIVWGGVVTLLLLLAIAGGRLWHTAHVGLATLETEIDNAVNADVFDERQGIAEVQLLDLTGDVAVVEVALPATAGMPLLHQTRVYRQTGTGWTRTAPGAAMWGRPRRLETTHFVFAYYERDEEAVQAAAAHLERLYPTLYAAFFTGPPSPDKHLFEVDPATAPGNFTLWMKRQDHHIVASPATYLAPGAVTPEALLTQSILLLLLDDIEYRLAVQYANLPNYQDHDGTLPLWSLVSGITLRQLWATDLPLAQWREPVVQWVLRDADTVSVQSRMKPSFKPELCAMHSLWMETPIYLQLPFACDARFEKTLAQEWRSVGLSYDWPKLPLTRRYITTGRLSHPARAAALATAVEYAAATYGPERIPALLAAMSVYDRWERLVVEVFGVSAEEFEAGWADYLATHYGITEIQ